MYLLLNSNLSRLIIRIAYPSWNLSVVTVSVALILETTFPIQNNDHSVYYFTLDTFSIIINMGGDIIAVITNFLRMNTEIISRILPFASLGVFYSSRLVLLGCPKSSSEQLQNQFPELTGFQEKHQKYYWLVIIASGSVALFINFANKVNWKLWDDPSLYLFSLFLITLALYDGFFALKTNIYPTTSRYNRNSYFFDQYHEYWWVAYLQLGLGFSLLLVGIILLLLLAFWVKIGSLVKKSIWKDFLVDQKIYLAGFFPSSGWITNS